MPIRYAQGDPLLTDAPALAFGVNGQGRVELTTLETCLRDRYPAAFATYARQCQQGRIQPGMIWWWRESLPRLGFMVVRASPQGATRLRYFDAVVITLARDYQRDGLRALALAAPGTPLEWQALKPLADHWFSRSGLDVTVYEQQRA